MTIRLKPGFKFFSKGTMYFPGEPLPEGKDALELLQAGKAERDQVIFEQELVEPDSDPDQTGKTGNDGQEAVEPQASQYAELTIRQLKDLIAERGLSLPKKINKDALIEVLDGAEQQESEDEGSAAGSP